MDCAAGATDLPMPSPTPIAEPSTPSFSPLYQQIKALILQSLQAGEWKPGEPIPSEIELAARYRVSQGTVRKAIDELAAENLVVRRQGKGTFVATHAEQHVQYRFLKLMPDNGDRAEEGPAERTVLECRRTRANADVARVLALQGLLGALGTGLAGFALRHLRAATLLALAMAATALGMGALAQGSALMVNWGFVPLFGVGSALVAMAVTVLLMEWFGHEAGTAGLALCWTLAGLAALGPGLAGVLAQWTGSYAGALWLLGAACLPVAVASAALRRA